MPLYRNFNTPLEIDEAYLVVRTVPSLDPYIANWVGQSERARKELPCELKVPFGPTVEEYVDIFPARDANAPILMFFHGGYWQVLTAAETDFVALGPVPSGVTVVVANYALCPSVTLDEVSRQARAAVAWTYRNAGKSFRGDPNRIHVMGHSAGGHLAAMTMLADWQNDYGLPANVVKGGIAIGGVYDLRPLPYTSVNMGLLLTQEIIARNSPQLLIRKAPSRLAVSWAAADPAEFIRQGQDFLSAWKEAGNAGSSFALPGTNHFDCLDGIVDKSSALTRKVVELVSA